MKFKYWNNEQNKKKHKNGLPLSYILPDLAGGIEHFNNSTISSASSTASSSGEGSAGAAMGEEWIAPHNLSYDEYKSEIKKRRPGYTFDRLDNSKNKEAVAFRELDRILKQDEERKAKKNKVKSQVLNNKINNFTEDDIISIYNGDEIYFKNGYYYLDNGMEFTSEEDVIEFLNPEED